MGPAEAEFGTPVWNSHLALIVADRDRHEDLVFIATAQAAPVETVGASMSSSPSDYGTGPESNFKTIWNNLEDFIAVSLRLRPPWNAYSPQKKRGW